MAELLDVLVRLAPNPTEGNPPRCLIGEGDKAVPYAVVPDAARHGGACVQGHLRPVRRQARVVPHSPGTVTRDSQLFIGDGRKPFKVGHLFTLFGKEHRR